MKTIYLNSKRTRHIALIFCLLGFSNTIRAEDLIDIEERALPAESIALFDAQVIDGDITINTHGKDEVLLKIHREVKNVSSEVAVKIMEALKTRFESEGNTIILRQDHPKNSREWKEATGEKQVRHSILYELWLPASLDLELKSVDGDIAVKEISGKSSISTVDGDITITSEGVLHIQAVDGDILAELNGQPKENSQINAVDGDIIVTLAPDLAVDIRLQSMDGDLEIQLPLDKQVSTRSQVVGSRNGGGPKIRINTVDGDIMLK